ncbi:MAG: methionine biosynthesis protein MetW [Legionella sp.]|nr:methionine biosynthesis protein MetW [Legionella sp.]
MPLVTLSAPLNIDVSELAKCFPEFRHRLPYSGVTSEFLLNDSNSDRAFFLCFDGKTDEGFTTIKSQYPPEELAVLLNRVPKHIAEPLKQALVGTQLEIPNLTESEMASLKKKMTKSPASSFLNTIWSERPRGYTGIRPEHVLLPLFNKGSKVLDVGAGDGYITQRLRDELGCNAYALEPGIGVKDGYAKCVERLGDAYAFNLTLHDAVTAHPEDFIGQFDAITVFKYNIPGAIKHEFANDLATCLKPDGIVHTTSVEHDKLYYSPSSGKHPYIVEALCKYFSSVTIEDVKTSGCTYGVVTCSGPKPELLHDSKLKV